jgi:hypothetical protein
MTRRSLLRRAICAPVAAAAGLTVAQTVPATVNQGHFMAVPAWRYAAYREYQAMQRNRAQMRLSCAGRTRFTQA